MIGRAGSRWTARSSPGSVRWSTATQVIRVDAADPVREDLVYLALNKPTGC